MRIRLFVTGGTFDKEYDEVAGALAFRQTHVNRMLELGRSRVDVAVEVLMLKDSLDLTDDDRARVVAACAACAEDRIVITHGTDTMVDTARALAAAITDRTVVLTGAMIPFAFGSSDGLFNLGSALSFAQALPHGVYVAMNGRWFRHDGVRKNRSTGVFEATGQDR
jgi:L-asparaginase